MTKALPLPVIVALFVGVGGVLSVVGIHGTFAAQTENTDISLETSDDGVTAKGQVTKVQPDAQTKSSIEGELTKDGAKVGIQNEYSYDFPPEVENQIDELGDALNIDEAKDTILGGIGIKTE